MPSAKTFFSETEQEQIIHAIQRAEGFTSGEIRVHVEEKLKGSVLDRSVDIFKKLKMDQTAERNGVLIFISVKEKQFAVIGDEGIHKHVTDQFWDDVKNAMQAEFENGRIANGVILGIEKAADQLKKYFPVSTVNKNELSDEISF